MKTLRRALSADKKILLTTLTLLLFLLTDQANALLFDKPEKTYYITHTVPRGKKHRKSSFRLKYFKILNGETGIKYGENFRIRLKGVILRKTGIEKSLIKVSLGFFSSVKIKEELRIPASSVEKGRFDITIEKKYIQRVMWYRDKDLKVKVILRDAGGAIIADYRMKIRVSEKPQ